MPSRDKLTEMERVSVQLTTEAKRQIIEWANAANVKPGYFMSVALTVGARALARQMAPEEFMTANVWSNVMQGFMAMTPEQLDAMGLDREKMAPFEGDGAKLKAAIDGME